MISDDDCKIISIADRIAKKNPKRPKSELEADLALLTELMKRLKVLQTEVETLLENV